MLMLRRREHDGLLVDVVDVLGTINKLVGFWSIMNSLNYGFRFYVSYLQ